MAENAPSLLSVVVPVFNEEQTVQGLLRAVLAAPLPDGMDREIVVVDDASVDGTQHALSAFADDETVLAMVVVENRFQDLTNAEGKLNEFFLYCRLLALQNAICRLFQENQTLWHDLNHLRESVKHKTSA